MAYINHWSMAADVTFQRKLAASLAKTCNDIQSESTATAFHSQRLVLVHLVVKDPPGWAARMANAVIQANTNLKTAADAGGTTGPWTVTDSDIDAGVSSTWNTFADVMT